MWKKYLALGMVMLFLASASTVSHASETVSMGQAGQEVETQELENEAFQTGQTGTYMPYEGAKYSLSFTVSDNGIVITGISDYESKSDLGELVIPAEINGVAVTTIGDRAFLNCNEFMGSLNIPEGVTTIGDYAFYGCSGLTGDLNIPEGVTTISAWAFRGCRGFTGSLNIPEGVTTIDEDAFLGCDGFTGSLNIPESVTTIGQSAFEGCSGFTGSLNIPEGVTTISAWAFRGCSGFTGSLNIPEGVTTIGERAFLDCDGFTGSLNIPESVTTIGRSAFMRCRGFTGSLNIPEGVTTIGESAFLDCDGFTGSLNIPESVTTIGDYAFMRCRGFTGSLNIPEGVTTIGKSAFWDCSGIKDVTVLGKQTEIPYGLDIAFVHGYSDSVVARDASKWSYTFIPIDAPEITEYRVSTVLELLDAIGTEREGSYRRIILADGVYNISDPIALSKIVFVTVEAENPGKVQILSQDAFKPVITVNQCANVNIVGCIVGYDPAAEQTGTAADFVQIHNSYDVNVKLYDQPITTTVSGGDMQVTVSMTEEEQKRFVFELAAQKGITVAEGKKVTVDITVSNAEGTLAEPDRQTINQFAAAGKYKIGQYLDIIMSLLTGDDSKPVSHTEKPVRLKMDIPKALQQAGRVFSVIRLHDGKAALLEDLDQNPDTVTIETDCFSAYTLVYQVNDESCSHTLTKVDAVPPTCIDDGNIEYWICSECGKKFADEAGTTELTDVTEKADGRTGDAWGSDSENHWKVCSVCGEALDKNAHTFTWVTDKAATENETGLKHEECVCGATRSEGTLIDKLASGEEGENEENKEEENKGDEDDDDTEEESDNNGQSKLPTVSPSTGEERVERTPTLQMGLIMAVCVILGAGLRYVKKRR